MEGGFARMYPLQACVRLAVKTRLYHRPAEAFSGMYRHPRIPRRLQADLGEVVAWRNMFWALSDSMCSGSDAVGQRRMAAGSRRAADLSRDGADGLRQDQEHRA